MGGVGGGHAPRFIAKSLKQAVRIILAIAVVAAIGTALAALTPVRGYVSPDMTVPGRVERPDVVDHIGCGSLIAPASWSARDGCEDARLTRGLWAAFGIIVAVLFGLIGTGMWMFGVRHPNNRHASLTL